MTAPAVGKLRAYLADRRETPHALARRAGVSPSRLWRILHGEWHRVGVGFATKVERATNGAVAVADWLEAS